MKKIVLFFCCALTLGIIAAIAYVKINSPQKALTKNETNPSMPPFALENAPSQSVKGNIISMSGTVNWQSRIATDSARLVAPRQIQQGEQIDTDVDGKAQVEFTGFTTLIISPKTQVNFIQTLPANFVIAQNKGIVTYTNTGSTHLSIRYLHLLTDIQSGQISVTIDENKPIADVRVIKGQLTLAYNDLQDMTQEVTIPQGKEFIFNDTTRKISL